MKKISRINMLILALAVAFSPARAFDDEKVGFKIGVVAACVGLAAVCIGLIWESSASKGSESHEQMLERIQREKEKKLQGIQVRLSRIQKKYDSTTSLMKYVNACENALPAPLPDLQEDQLKTLFYNSFNGYCVHSLKSKVEDALKTLEKSKKELEKSIKEYAEELLLAQNDKFL